MLCMYVCMHVCMYVCMYVYIYIYMYRELAHVTSPAVGKKKHLPGKMSVHRAHSWFPLRGSLFACLCC